MLSKEIEFQGLEVELQNKKIGEAQRAIDSRKADVENAKHQLEERRADLDMKSLNSTISQPRLRLRKRSSAKRPRTLNRPSSPVCSQPSSAFAKFAQWFGHRLCTA